MLKSFAANFFLEVAAFYCALVFLCASIAFFWFLTSGNVFYFMNGVIIYAFVVILSYMAVREYVAV